MPWGTCLCFRMALSSGGWLCLVPLWVQGWEELGGRAHAGQPLAGIWNRCVCGGGLPEESCPSPGSLRITFLMLSRVTGLELSAKVHSFQVAPLLARVRPARALCP